MLAASIAASVYAGGSGNTKKPHKAEKPNAVIAVYEALTSKRGEYESSLEYEARRNAAAVEVAHEHAAMIDDRYLHVFYDADKEVFVIDPETENVHLSTAARAADVNFRFAITSALTVWGRHVAQNAFGAKATVTDYFLQRYFLADWRADLLLPQIHVSCARAVARGLRNDLAVIVVFNPVSAEPSEPHEHKATITEPYDGITADYTVVGNISEFRVIRRSTHEVLARLVPRTTQVK
jgi:hypothetical protein